VHEVLCRVAEVVEAPDALDLLARATSDLGASASCFVSAVRDTDGGAAAYRMLLACDPRWGARYMQNSWFETDPWLAYAMRAEAPILASSLTPGNDAERCMLSSAAEHGFRSTVIAPAPSAAGVSRFGVLYVRPLAQALAMELHAWWMRVLRDDLMRGSRITGDEVALLRHEAVGHGSKAIAAELHTEAKTIDCRFQRLNAKLGAPNRRAAVRIARFYGLL
jgi:DNA-binding CsgD family transcriptional regulator